MSSETRPVLRVERGKAVWWGPRQAAGEGEGVPRSCREGRMAAASTRNAWLLVDIDPPGPGRLAMTDFKGEESLVEVGADGRGIKVGMELQDKAICGRGRRAAVAFPLFRDVLRPLAGDGEGILFC